MKMFQVGGLDFLFWRGATLTETSRKQVQDIKNAKGKQIISLSTFEATGYAYWLKYKHMSPVDVARDV